MGTETDLQVHLIEKATYVLSRVADAERCARNVARVIVDRTRRLHHRLRNDPKVQRPTLEHQKLLVRLQTRILMDAWPAQSIVDICDACEEAGVDEWRIKTAFEEVCDMTIGEAVKTLSFLAFTRSIPEEQEALLLSIWTRVNLPVPPLPEHNEPCVEYCRGLNVGEWRIAAALTRVTGDGDECCHGTKDSF
jgi:hypothetical protein